MTTVSDLSSAITDFEIDRIDMRLVETPCRYDSAIALIKALSTREYLSNIRELNAFSRNCGLFRDISPTLV
jgi:hypothetical protein